MRNSNLKIQEHVDEHCQHFELSDVNVEIPNETSKTWRSKKLLKNEYCKFCCKDRR